MIKRSTLGLGLALVLAACGSTAPQNSNTNNGASAASEQSKATTLGVTTLTECQALYNTAPTRPQRDANMRYGSVGTLILSFIDDTTKGHAIGWMDANLDVDLGNGLGALENLPMVAVQTLVTEDLIAKLEANLSGLVSIYQDEPLQYFLNSSASFIGAPQAREAFGVTGKGVGVVVLDSGIDATHPDLQLGQNVGRNVKIAGSILTTPVGGYLYADLTNTDTTSGHGTHVAGTIAGTGAYSKGKYTGIAPGATLVGVGAGDGISILYALQGFDFALKPEIREAYNVRVISNSWGSSGPFAPYNPISLATKRAYDLGIIVNFAAGNSGPGENTLNPYSASPCAMSVAAGDKQGNLANFSSRGIKGDQYTHPDITAPGVQIIATRAQTGAVTPPYTADPENALYYSSISGTSMATPHVSGVVALMLEANPALTLDDILPIFKKTAKPMFYTDASGNTLQRELWEVGYGYVDAYASVKAAVKSNPNAYSLETSSLPGWTGTISPEVCLVDCTTNAQHAHTLSVASGASALRVKTDWGNAAYDLDLYVYDPSGALIASSAQAVSAAEAVEIPNPVAGDYKVVLKGYLNAATTYTGTAEVDKLVRK